MINELELDPELDRLLAERAEGAEKTQKIRARKGTLKVVRIINHFAKRGHETIQANQVHEALKALSLLDDDVAGVGSVLNRASIGDILGGHCLKLEATSKKARGGIRYRIPVGGITKEWLEERSLILDEQERDSSLAVKR